MFLKLNQIKLLLFVAVFVYLITKIARVPIIAQIGGAGPAYFYWQSHLDTCRDSGGMILSIPTAMPNPSLNRPFIMQSERWFCWCGIIPVDIWKFIGCKRYYFYQLIAFGLTLPFLMMIVYRWKKRASTKKHP